MIPVAKPLMDDAEVQAAGRAILSGWVTQGPEVAAFEREFAAYVGAAHACAVSSGTTALHLALLAVGVRPGDEVVTVSHSYIATANVVRYCGAMPVFVDVRAGHLQHRPHADRGRDHPAHARHPLRAPDRHAVRPRGHPGPGAPARAGRSSRTRPAPSAARSCWNGRWERIGRPHGDIACFSFHPRKLVSTGDGGMITTANPEWDAAVAALAAARHERARHHPPRLEAGDLRVVSRSLGYNYRMTDIQAAVGREQLKRLPGFLERRRRLARRYLDGLAGLPGLVLPVEPAWARTNWQSFCVRLADDLDQRDVMQRLLDLGIASRRGVMCAHREPAYTPDTWTCRPAGRDCECAAGTCNRLVESEKAQDHGVILPLYDQMTEADQDRVIAALRAICAG